MSEQEQRPSERMTDEERVLWRTRRIMANKGRCWSLAMKQAAESVEQSTTTTKRGQR